MREGERTYFLIITCTYNFKSLNVSCGYDFTDTLNLTVFTSAGTTTLGTLIVRDKKARS